MLLNFHHRKAVMSDDMATWLGVVGACCVDLNSNENQMKTKLKIWAHAAKWRSLSWQRESSLEALLVLIVFHTDFSTALLVCIVRICQKNEILHSEKMQQKQQNTLYMIFFFYLNLL